MNDKFQEENTHTMESPYSNKNPREEQKQDLMQA